MSDKMRWRYGDTNPVVAAVDSDTVIEIGDLVLLNTDDAKPASMLVDQGTKAANQAAFAAIFLGRGDATQPKRRDRADPRGHHRRVRVRLRRAGRSSWATWSASTRTPAGNALLNQQVAKVTAAADAVGRVAKRQPAAGTSVLVDIRSTVMTGGVNGTHGEHVVRRERD